MNNLHDNRQRIEIVYLVLYTLLSILLITGFILVTPEGTGFIKVMKSSLTSALIFAIPVCMVAALNYNDPAKELGLRKPLLSPKGWILLAISFPVFMIVTSLVGELINQLIPLLPEAIRNNIESTGKAYNDLIQSQVDDLNGSLLWSFLFFALLPALVEELFFRGALLLSLRKLLANRIHLSIWLAAIIFSLVHMDLMGFIPRTLLGAYFGYAYYYSKSLWVPIALHTINNSMAIWIHF